ncbi:MAG: 4-alpha-glucanotransferase [Verrucomicrobiae bacterium]|nr:4-alpha-glucanotransferase [Verrucomicrobiae bacterium]
MKLSPDTSLAGVLVPVFAIRTADDLGIGDTEGVRQMIEWCHRHGLNLLQTLPINETSDDNSPYNAISSLAIEPTTLTLTPRALPDLSPKKFRTLAPPERLAELRRGPVRWADVKALKQSLLEAAFESFFKRHFERETERARRFRAFLAANADWLADYALFRVLMEENGGTPAWERWPEAHRGPRRARTWLLSLPSRQRAALERRQLFRAYVQWIAFEQWQAVKAQGEARRVFLMGDMPFGVSRHSADVWAQRAFFDLDWCGGAPPERTFKVDAFTEKWGQNWGIPLYRWDELRRHNFEWWRTRVRNLCAMFHLYRIDHVLGLFRIYAFPWTPDRNAEFLPLSEAEAAARTGGRLPGFKPFPDDTPEHKAFNQAQGEELLRMIQEASGETTVVAEDLGVVPDYVPPTLEKLGIPGFRIPMLFREPDGAYSDPKQYPRLSLAQPATHDHPPLAAQWQECWASIEAGRDAENAQRELQHMMRLAGLGEEPPPRQFEDRIHDALMRAVLGARSWLAVFQIQDIFGQPERFNTPGSIAPTNWTHRLAHTVREFDTDPRLRARAETFARMAREAGRGL